MAQLTKYDRPSLQSISNLRQEMDQIFNELIPFSWRLNESGSTIRPWTPRTDMRETEDEYIIETDLPGMRKEDLSINVQDSVLTIEGERKHESKEEHKGYLQRERSYGSFNRKFTLPVSVMEEKIKASFQDGVLTVHVPKAEKSKRKTVKID